MKTVSLAIVAALLLCFTHATHARPPKPGTDFIWVGPHTTADGRIVPGHWKYIGPKIEGKVWIPGHRSADGTWIAGHWQKVPSAKRVNAVWVKGHFGPHGHWIPGHWRYLK